MVPGILDTQNFACDLPAFVDTEALLLFVRLHDTAKPAHQVIFYRSVNSYCGFHFRLEWNVEMCCHYTIPKQLFNQASILLSDRFCTNAESNQRTFFLLLA